MITEDYVSFEIAKLLKEKGFDEICYLGYNKNGEYVPTNNRTNSQIIQPDFCFICCPTLQMARKWLEKEHNLHIQIWILEEEGYWFNIEKILNEQYKHKSLYCTGLEDIYFNSSEQASEAAIKYCLENLI